MATINIGTTQSDWTLEDGTAATAAFSDPGAYAYNASIPSTNTGTGVFVIALPDVGTMGNPLSDCCFMLLFYFVSMTNPIGVKARIWGLSPFGSGEALGTFFGECIASQGATDGPAGADSYFCPSITIVNDRTLTPPGMRLPGSPVYPADSVGAATLVLDAIGCSHIVVELRRQDGDSLDEVGLCWRSF